MSYLLRALRVGCDPIVRPGCLRLCLQYAVPDSLTRLDARNGPTRSQVGTIVLDVSFGGDMGEFERITQRFIIDMNL